MILNVLTTSESVILVSVKASSFVSNCRCWKDKVGVGTRCLDFDFWASHKPNRMKMIVLNLILKS